MIQPITELEGLLLLYKSKFPHLSELPLDDETFKNSRINISEMLVALGIDPDAPQGSTKAALDGIREQRERITAFLADPKAYWDDLPPAREDPIARSLVEAFEKLLKDEPEPEQS